MPDRLSSSSDHTRAVTLVDLAAASLVGLLFLVASVRFGGSVAGDELDPSWTMVLRWASLHGLRWGSDIVFTYGPLGYLYPLNACDPASYGSFVAAQIALAAAAGFLFANAWIAQRWPERAVLALAVLVGAPLLAADPVWLSMPLFALAGMYAHAVAGRRRALWLLLLVAALYTSTILLIKMSSLLLVLACWLAGTALLWRRRLPRHAAAWLLLIPGCSLALWLFSGQRLGDLLPFLDSVFEISRGYTAAMGVSPPLRYDLYGLAVLGCSGGIGLWAAWRSRHDPARLACIALWGFTLFVAWRAGFTRADTHVAIFALAAWLLLPLLPAMTAAPRPWLRVVSLLLALAVVPLADRCFNPGMGHKHGELAVASLHTLRNNLGLLARPLTYHQPLMAALDRERLRLDLPQTRAAVGRGSVDLLGTQQGVVIINGFAYRPSPLFQGYGAYTPRLQRLNAAAFSGPQRTDFVLLAFSPIDGNLPSSENALAFTTLYQNYHPLLVEKSYLLLEKDEVSVPPPLPPQSGWRQAGWNDWIDLPTSPDSVSVLALRSELSPAGKAMAALLREPGQFIELELADATVHRFRLVRGAAQGGFLASPLLQSLDDYVHLFAGTGDLPPVRRFRLVPQSAALRALFAGTIQWNVAQLPRRPRGELPPAMRDALFPGFSPPPQAWTGRIRTLEVGGRRALFMHSPAQLRFRPGAGRYVVSGEIGIVANAFDNAGCRAGDGVEVKVSGGGATLAHAYDPFADASLRPARRFELGPVEASPDGTLLLDVAPGAAGNSDCDWTYVRDITLSPAQGQWTPAVP